MKQQYYDEMLASLPREKLFGASILITGANGMIASALAETLILMNRRMDLNMKLYLLCRGRVKAEERFRAYLNDPAVSFVNQDVSEPLECDIAFRYIIHAASSAYPRAFNTVPVDVSPVRRSTERISTAFASSPRIPWARWTPPASAPAIPRVSELPKRFA